MISQNNDTSKIRVAILASGTGSNAVNIIKYVREKKTNLEITCLICDYENAAVIKKAEDFGISVECFKVSDDKRFSFGERKEAQEAQVISYLNSCNVKWVFLAGYMRILSANFLDSFCDQKSGLSKIVNIHPSLLPAFRGKDAYEQAFSNGNYISGATIHLVDKGTDTGPIIMQEAFLREKSDNLQDFKEKGLQVEHKLYRKFIDLFDQGEANINKQILKIKAT